jgi:hypothetical protein
MCVCSQVAAERTVSTKLTLQIVGLSEDLFCFLFLRCTSKSLSTFFPSFTERDFPIENGFCSSFSFFYCDIGINNPQRWSSLSIDKLKINKGSKLRRENGT